MEKVANKAFCAYYKRNIIVAVIPSVSTASTLPLRGDFKIVRVLSVTYHKVFVQTFNNFSGIFGQIFSFGSDELLLHIKQSQKITHPQNYHFFDVAPFVRQP